MKTAPKDIAAQARVFAYDIQAHHISDALADKVSGLLDQCAETIEAMSAVGIRQEQKILDLESSASALSQPAREAAQRERMAEIFSGRTIRPATADFDLIAPNDALLYEHEDGRYAVNPDTTGDPKWHRLGPVQVHAAPDQDAQVDEPYAYAVYFPNQQREEIVHDTDELLEDMTNDTHTVTALFTGPPERVALTDEQIDQVAHAQDDEGWFVSRLTAAEWRSFGRDVLTLAGIGTSATKEGVPDLRSEAYDMVDRFLRNNLSDMDYADYSQALDLIYTEPSQ